MSNNNKVKNDKEMPYYGILSSDNGEDFQTELQKNIDQYRYGFEKRLFNVLNKDLFDSSFDPKNNTIDTNGNSLKNSFIYSMSSLNLNNDKRLGSKRWNYKSENNISELRKRNNFNQSQYISKSYNNISRNYKSENNIYDLSGKKISRNKKEIRKTIEDLRKELNNLEHDFKDNSSEEDEDKIIDLRKKELHKNYKEYIKLNPNIETSNSKKYNKYGNDFELVKKRHLEAMNKQNTQKTTTDINEITERLYNPENYPNVYKMKFNASKSSEKIDSNLNKKKSSSKKKLINSNDNEEEYSKSELNLHSNDNFARARMIDQINNFSPLSPENFTMKSSKTKKSSTNSLNVLNTTTTTNNNNNNNSYKDNINKNMNNIENSHENLKDHENNKNKNLNNNMNNNNYNYNKNDEQKNKISNSQKNISINKARKVGASKEEIHQKSPENSEKIKHILKNIYYSNNGIHSTIELNKFSNNLKAIKNELKNYTSISPANEKSKKNEKINRSINSITENKKNQKHHKYNNDDITEMYDYEEDGNYIIEDEDTGEQAAMQFQQIMSVSSKSLNNTNN